MQIWKSNTNHWPNKVCDDEQLYDPVDDAHRPALYHHGLGGLVGEEVSDAAPQEGAHGYLSVQVRERLYGSGPPEYMRNFCPVCKSLWMGEVIMSMSSLLILMREVFRLFCHSLLCCTFICFIKYLMVRPHCLSPLPQCLCSLAYNTNGTSPSFTQMSERKMWQCPSLFLLLSSPQIPVFIASFLSPSLM